MMKNCYYFSKFYAYFICVFPLCNGIILVKIWRGSHFFEKCRWEGEDLQVDPIEDFQLASRQLLCDAILTAKQFAALYHPKYYTQRIRQPGNVRLMPLHKPHDPYRMNFQRSYSNLSSNRGGRDPALMYLFRNSVRRNTGLVPVRSLQCLNTPTEKWFITFGGVHKYMFLLEPTVRARFNVVGLFEPSAIISKRHVEYFFKQFPSSRDAMKSRVCDLGVDDHLRLCGSVLDALSTQEKNANIPQVTLLKREFKCVKRAVTLPKSRLVTTEMLRCLTEHDPYDTRFTSFVVLADIHQDDAVFVFLDDKTVGKIDGKITTTRLYTRVTKIGALRHPVGRPRIEAKERSQAKNKNKNKRWKEKNKKNMVL